MHRFFFIFIFLFILSFLYPEDRMIGNKLYSPHLFTVEQQYSGGFSGNKDYFNQGLRFRYRASSSDLFVWGFYLQENAFLPGVFSQGNDYFPVGFMAGPLFMLKVFSPTEGVFFSSAVGLSIADSDVFPNTPVGFASNINIGFGDFISRGVMLDLTYIFNRSLITELNIYYTLFKYFRISGVTSIIFMYDEYDTNFFSWNLGIYPGFNINNIFNLSFGGGFTMNDYQAFRWHIGLFINFEIKKP